MRRLARPLPSPLRVVLDAGWEIACTPGHGGLPPASAWRALPSLLPAAAALQALGDWSLDGAARDFDQDTWWYRCRFDLPQLPHLPHLPERPDGAPDGAWRLGLDGLAGLAELSLNGQALLASQNMFRGHELLLEADRLREQGNELLIRFDPLQQALAARRPRPRWRVPMLAHQQLRFWRTTLLGRTPGWSPPAALVGPWRPVWLEPAEPLEPLQPTQLTQLALRAELLGDQGRLHVSLGLPAGVVPGHALRVRVERAGVSGAAASAGAAGSGTPAGPSTVYQAALVPSEAGLWSARVELPGVARWWPHTHGEPALYQVTLLVDDGSAAPRRLPLGKVGFRRLHLDQSGGGFRLVVNDVAVFARGACWTPLDPLRLRATPTANDTALAQVAAAGLNMLRISGAMVYEDEAFFDACDAHGVLVWQDLMFANMDYPADEAGFIAEVDEEVAQQMSRLQGRPSVALVCGNSEVEQQAAMWGAPRESWSPPLFHEHLPAQVARHLPGVPWWPSSAHGGAFPFQPAVGTASYYGVGAYCRETGDARSSGLRFASECLGFANIPTDTTLARLRELNDGVTLRVHSPLWKARASRDLGAGYDFDDVRDHYVERLFGERADELRRHDPARHLALGRAATAEAITAAYSQWRAAGSACGGALVWFLRDLWAGAGWGLLDDQGLPKSGFHALVQVCQPLHLGVTDDGLNGLTLHLVNERPQPQAGMLVVSLYREGEAQVAQAERAVTLAARGAEALPLAALGEGFMDWSWAYRFGPPPADVLVARWLADDGSVLAERVHFIGDSAGAGRLPRADIGLQAHSVALPDGRRRVTVRSRAAARSVHLEIEGWQASEEFFHLPPGGERVLHCTPVAGQRRAWRASLWAINALAPATVKEGC